MQDTRSDLIRQISELRRQAEWLPEWAVIALVLAAFVGIGWIAHKIVFAILRRVVKDKDVFWRGVVERARLKLRVMMILIGIGVGVSVSPLGIEASNDVRSVLLILFILTVGWLLSGVLDMWAVMHLKRYNIAVEDNLLARKHLTQTR